MCLFKIRLLVPRASRPTEFSRHTDYIGCDTLLIVCEHIKRTLPVDAGGLEPGDWMHVWRAESQRKGGWLLHSCSHFRLVALRGYYINSF